MSYAVRSADVARVRAGITDPGAGPHAQGMTWALASYGDAGERCATSSSSGGMLSVDLPASVRR